ncbi:MAG: LamG domain-containing protein, partial [Patescibacteria group bacterium]
MAPLDPSQPHFVKLQSGETVQGNVVVTDIGAGNFLWTKGTGTITFSGSSIQQVNFAGTAVEDIVVEKTHGTAQFRGAATADSILVSSGTVDFNGKAITTIGDLNIGVLGQVAPRGLPGSAIAVGGNLSLTGAAGDLLNLSATGAWTLDVTGTATAQYVTAAYSDASGGTEINALGGTNTNGGNNTNWNFGESIAGKLYSDEGVTPLSSKVVTVALNGGPKAASGTTDGNGYYSIVGLNTTGGTVVTLYVDGADEDAVTVVLGSGGNMTGVHLYQNRLIVRSESGSVAVTNASLGVASLSAGSDTDISAIFSVSSGVLTAASNKELLVWAGDTFAPGGNIAVHDMDINGTLTMAGNTATVSGSWDATGGSFGFTTGKALFTSASDEVITPNGQSFNDVYINDGLVGYWKLDEAAAGTFADASGYGNTGTGNGATGGNNTPQPSDTKPSLGFANAKALDFDGTDDTVSVPDSPSLQLGYMTVSAWVYFDGSGDTYQRIVDKVYNGEYAFYVQTDGTVGVALVTDAASTDWFTTGVTVSNAAWTHLAFAWDGSNIKLYKNGAYQTQTALAGTTVADTGNTLYIGDRAGLDRSWNGKIDEVRIYNRALSATEISALAAGNQPATENTAASEFSLASALDINGSLSLNSGELDAAGNAAITLSGSLFVNGGKLTARAGTVTLGGGGAQTLLSGGQEFKNLTVNKAMSNIYREARQT